MYQYSNQTPNLVKMPLIFSAYTVYEYGAKGVYYTKAPSKQKHYIKSPQDIPQCFPCSIKKTMHKWIYPTDISYGSQTSALPDVTPFRRGEKIIMLGSGLCDHLDRERITSSGIMEIRRHTQHLYMHIKHLRRLGQRQRRALLRDVQLARDERQQLLVQRETHYKDSRRSLFKAMAHPCACPVCDNNGFLAVTFPCMHTAMCMTCWNEWASQSSTLEEVQCPTCRGHVAALWCENRWRMEPTAAEV